MLGDDALDAVVLAVPAADHYELARRALERGKHVYVEKPMTLNAATSTHFVELAAERERVLMVGHLLKYHPAVQCCMIWYGKVRWATCIICIPSASTWALSAATKMPCGAWHHTTYRSSCTCSAKSRPRSVPAASAIYNPALKMWSLPICTLRWQMAQMQISWLDPHRIRRLTVVGSLKMAVFDDVESTEKVRIYDKSAERPQYDSYGDSIALRFGDVVIPRLQMAEPLKLECQHFAECVRTGQTPRSDGRDGLRVVRVLEAAQVSLRQAGAPVPLR